MWQLEKSKEWCNTPWERERGFSYSGSSPVTKESTGTVCANIGTGYLTYYSIGADSSLATDLSPAPDLEFDTVDSLSTYAAPYSPRSNISCFSSLDLASSLSFSFKILEFSQGIRELTQLLLAKELLPILLYTEFRMEWSWPQPIHTIEKNTDIINS